MPTQWDMNRWVLNEDGSYSRKRDGASAAVVEEDEGPNITKAAADLAEELGVDVSELEGSGLEGRITKGDVEEAASVQ